jgi:peptide/nickel transport system substrate-binding protein
LEAWANDPNLQPVSYNPDTASALLEGAGWIDMDGDGIRECHGCLYAEEGTRLAFTIAYAPITDENANLALVAQDQLHRIGFDVTVNRIEYVTMMNEYVLPQKFDAAVLSLGGFPADPDERVTLFLKSQNDQPGIGRNVTSVVNPEIDQLLEAGRRVPGCAIEERAPYYHQIQEIGLENMYVADWAFVTYDYLVVSKSIQGFVQMPRGGEGSEYNSIQDWTFSQ